MKKTVLLSALLLASTSAVAATDHYVLRDGSHVHHLKVTNVSNEVHISADVDFEPNASEKDAKPCSGEISGEAKTATATEIVFKKHSETEAGFCELKITLSPNGAKVEQSKDCENFAPGICHFDSDGKELIKVK